MWKKWITKRKKGSIILEFIGMFPILMVIIMILAEIFVYAMTISDFRDAADEGARVVAMQVRGFEGPIRTGDQGGYNPSLTYTNGVRAQLTPQMIENIEMQLKSKIDNSLRDNHFTDFFDAENALLVTDETGGSGRCTEVFNDLSIDSAICVYTEPIVHQGRPFEVIVVKLKAQHRPLTQFGRWITARHIKVRGTSQKEMSKQFQYYFEGIQEEDIEPIPQM